MAHVYVGFHDQRSCNRILKPPGGGTSNIFGTDSVPDVVPQSSPRKDHQQQRGTSMQQLLQTETVTTVTSRQQTSSSATNGNVTSVETTSSESTQNGNTSNENNLQEIALPTQELIEHQNGNSSPDPDVDVEVTCKVERLRIEEKTSKSEVTETDAAGNTRVIASDGNTERSVEQNSSFKKGSTIEDYLKHDDIEEKKKIKGPAQRVPPGGYSSGLW